ncbi:hypothetical protein ABW54_03895 [Burkholderia cenocepacia]|nr:hypothetical protein ABW54_03895 [Burkholderia cenocepacia]
MHARLIVGERFALARHTPRIVDDRCCALMIARLLEPVLAILLLRDVRASSQRLDRNRVMLSMTFGFP